MIHKIADLDVFKSLHTKDTPLVLLNIWDAGSAKIIADAGAKAIATGSWAVAAANGYQDGEALPFDIALQTLDLIVKAVDLPVTMDIESGYGTSADQVGETITRAVNTGAIGINLEDQVIGANALYDIKDQAERIAACRKSADAAGVPAFINARSDIFFQADAETPIEQLVNKVLERATAYHQAGADGLFTPGLVDEAAIKAICDASPMPVNIMMMPNGPDLGTLAKLGVSRISYGPAPYLSAMESIIAQSRTIYS